MFKGFGLNKLLLLNFNIYSNFKYLKFKNGEEENLIAPNILLYYMLQLLIKTETVT